MSAASSTPDGTELLVSGPPAGQPPENTLSPPCGPGPHSWWFSTSTPSYEELHAWSS